MDMDLDMICEKYTLSTAEHIQFCNYIHNSFAETKEKPPEAFEQLGVWKKLAALAEIIGAAAVINKKICPSHPIGFMDPEGVRLEIYDSFAGEIPIIYADNVRDFEALVTNIVYKGVSPDDLQKTGALFVSGNSTRFIILSSKPYSNVTADELGLDENEWAEKSMSIRRSHECTHYFTKQTYGISQNSLHDELMADFIGLYKTFGFYKAEWFLRFMGVIPGSGDRMKVYTYGLMPKVRAAINEIAASAAYGLEKWSESESFRTLDDAARIKEMAHMGIARMAEFAAY